MMKKLLKISVLFILSAFLFGCGSKENKTVLNVYTGLEEYLNHFIEMYKADFPNVELNIIREEIIL